MPSLKERIESAMEHGYERSHRETAFIANDALLELFATQALQQNLRRDFQEYGNQKKKTKAREVEELAEYVKTSATKLYAVLVLLEQSKRIIQLFRCNPRITDKIFEQSDDKYGPYCHMTYLQNCKYLEDVATEFFDMQWCIPPKFDDQKHQRFPETHLRFPFTSKPERLPEQGSWGVVSRVTLAGGHLNPEYDVLVGLIVLSS
jgi:hypothetical protein